MGKIDFFKMSGCFFCDEAEKMLREQIQSGIISIKSAEQCQQDGHSPRGFPFFHCGETGESQTGLPKSFEDLCAKLGISSHSPQMPHTSHHPTPIPGSDGVCKVWVMSGCPWCSRLIDEIEPLVKANKCKIIQHNDPSDPPPAGVSGFPHSVHKGKTASGYMTKADFVRNLEIDVTEVTQIQEQFPMRQLQETLYHNELAGEQTKAMVRENFKQQAAVSAAATTEQAVAKAQNKRIQSATVDCDKYTTEHDCFYSPGQQNCLWNEGTKKCGLDPRASSQVIDPRLCRPGNCPPLKPAVPIEFTKIMLEGNEVAWVDEFGLVGPDAFTMLAFSGCESDGNGSGGCKSGYSMFGVF